MQFYSQTLDDIPKEFMSHQKSGGAGNTKEKGDTFKTEDMLFILALLLFLQDEPIFPDLE